MPTSAAILITGATDGLGLALARRYYQQGARLILSGRRPLAELDAIFFHADNYGQVDLASQDCATFVSHWLHEGNIEARHLLVHNSVSFFPACLGRSHRNLTISAPSGKINGK